MNWIKIRSYFIDVVLVFVSIIVSFLIIEFIFRFTPLVQLLPYRYGIPPSYHRPDGELVYDIAPNFATTTYRFRDGKYDIWSNELGCFDLAYSGETPYILLLGDSFTWGIVPFQDKWGTILEKSTGLRTLKCGVAGYGTKQELIKGKRLLDRLPPPKLVVLGYFANDPSDDGKMLAKSASREDLSKYPELEKEYCMFSVPKHPASQRAKCFLTRHSIIYMVSKLWLKKIIPEKFLEGSGLVNQPPSVIKDDEAHYKNIYTLSELALSKGAKLMVVFVPLPYKETDDEDIYVEVKKYLKKEKIAYIDLKDKFNRVEKDNGIGLYWAKDRHWNTEGNRLAGLLVSEVLLTKGYLQDNSNLSAIRASLSEDFRIK